MVRLKTRRDGSVFILIDSHLLAVFAAFLEEPVYSGSALAAAYVRIGGKYRCGEIAFAQNADDDAIDIQLETYSSRVFFSGPSELLNQPIA